MLNNSKKHTTKVYHPKVETQKKKKKNQTKIELQERINKRERERERTITFFGRECETNNKII